MHNIWAKKFIEAVLCLINYYIHNENIFAVTFYWIQILLNTLCFKEIDWNVRNVKVIKHEKNLSQHGFDFPMYPLVHKCCFHVTAKMVWSQITLTHATHIYYISNKIFYSFYTLSVSLFFLFSALSTHSCFHLLSINILKNLGCHKLFSKWSFKV